MKKVFSLLVVFLMIFNIMVPVMAVTNMENESEIVSSDDTKLNVESTEEELEISYHKGYTLLKSGRLKEFSDKNRIISEKIKVEKDKTYCFKNISAKYGNCFYVIYNENDEVIDYLNTDVDSNGEVIKNVRKTMPEDAVYIRVACDLNVNNKMFELYCSRINENK